MSQDTGLSKTAWAKGAGISRSMLYYRHKLFAKDWRLKIRIEKSLHDYPSYGHKRLARVLKVNKKRVLRVMKRFGIKPYRRRGRKYRKPKKNKAYLYPNLLIDNMPSYPGHIWASDFTRICFHGKVIYLATVLDIFSREIMGWSVMTGHGVQLVMQAVISGISYHAKPEIIHSDQGSEYTSATYTSLISMLGIRQSMSHKGSPWENGYQESFYNQFKIDLGDPNRFDNLGELVAAIHETIYVYNTDRIHSKLKMAPRQYAILNSLIQGTQKNRRGV